MFYLVEAWDKEEAIQNIKNNKESSFIGEYEDYDVAEYFRESVNCTSYIISEEELK